MFSEDGRRWRKCVAAKQQKKVISQLRCSFAGLRSERGLEPSAAAGDASKEAGAKIRTDKNGEGKEKKGHLKKNFYSRVWLE